MTEKPMKLIHPFTLLVAFGLALVFPSQSLASKSTHPNVIVILTDDQGWGDLSLHGNRNLNTPRIDSLARTGAQFDRFYVCPVCSPTRAEFLTGRYHVRSGVYSTSAGGERFDLGEQTIAEAFQAAGYTTGAFGKWHNGMQYPYHPNGRGFDEFYGFCSGHWGNYFNPPLERNGQLVRGEGFVVDDFTTQAIEFMRKHQDQPFFTYLAYNTPHSPMQVPDAYWDRFDGKTLSQLHREPRKEKIEHTRAALAMCENIDWNVGRLLDTLDELELAQDTIVVYFCDNGPNGNRWNGGMKGRKGSTDEGGVRSPLLIRWPGHIPAGKTVTQISAAIDLLPTLTDLAGLETHIRRPLDGISLKPLLTQTESQWPDRLIFSTWRNRTSVRSQQFRLDHQGALFDLSSDPGQHLPIQEARPEVHARLSQALEQWKADTLPTETPADRPFPIGHADFAYTQIPARDGIPHGTIKRSNRFPNDSFFYHWTQTADAITWDVAVLTQGRYAVDLYYACAPANVGVELKLSFKDHAVTHTVTEAHNPPLQGAENDRTPRVESYVKEFRSLRLGEITLPSGEGQLKLEATRIPGPEAIEFRLMMFTRLP